MELKTEICVRNFDMCFSQKMQGNFREMTWKKIGPRNIFENVVCLW